MHQGKIEVSQRIPALVPGEPGQIKHPAEGGHAAVDREGRCNPKQDCLKTTDANWRGRARQKRKGPGQKLKTELQ